MNDAERIDKLGGPARVALLLGLDKARGAVQRVHNWKSRGIPAKVKLEYPQWFVLPLADQGADAAAVDVASREARDAA